MAELGDDAMARLERLDTNVSELRGAVIQITHLLTEASERTSAGFRAVYGEIGAVRAEVSELRGEVNGLRGEVNGLRGEVNGVREEMRETREALASRLDRLIAVTLQEGL